MQTKLPTPLPGSSIATPAKLVTPLKGHIDATTLAFSPDRCLLATGSHEGAARVWSIASSRPNEQLDHPHARRAVSVVRLLFELAECSRRFRQRAAVWFGFSTCSKRRRRKAAAMLQGAARGTFSAIAVLAGQRSS